MSVRNPFIAFEFEHNVHEFKKVCAPLKFYSLLIATLSPSVVSVKKTRSAGIEFASSELNKIQMPWVRG